MNFKSIIFSIVATVALVGAANLPAFPEVRDNCAQEATKYLDRYPPAFHRPSISEGCDECAHRALDECKTSSEVLECYKKIMAECKYEKGVAGLPAWMIHG